MLGPHHWKRLSTSSALLLLFFNKEAKNELVHVISIRVSLYRLVIDALFLQTHFKLILIYRNLLVRKEGTGVDVKQLILLKLIIIDTIEKALSSSLPLYIVILHVISLGEFQRRRATTHSLFIIYHFLEFISYCKHKDKHSYNNYNI